MKIAVIGIGGTGSAALRFLARAGHQAVGFEQFKIGHDRGSSHGESRIIRYLYPDPLYTNLMRDAYPLWRDLEAESKQELLVTTGGIFIGNAESPAISDTRASLESAGCSYEVLDADAAGRRFPDFRFADNEVALYQEDTGFLRASACVATNVRLAVDAGATLHEGVHITAVEPEGARVRVRMEDGDEFFDHAIITAGPWMGEILSRLGMPLRVTRQYVAYVGGEAANSAAPGRMPAWIDFGSPETLYGIPHDGRIPGVKLAMHQFGPEADPNALPTRIPDSTIARIEEYARGRFHFDDPRVTESVACLYTVTPDEDFIVDNAGRGITFVSGCSGHGFKFTVLLGKIAADLAAGGDYAGDLSRFSLARFDN
jgi:monomeric sarcosine oxidase